MTDKSPISAPGKAVALRMGRGEWGMLVLLSFCWGSSFAFNEVLLEELPPITIVWGRQIVAFLLFVPLSLPYWRRTVWSMALLWRLVFMGSIAIALPFSLFALGQQYITSVLAGIGNGTVPLFTMLIAAAWLKDEPLTPLAVGGLGLGFSGIIMLFFPMLSMGDWVSAIGFAATLVASAMYGFANVFARSIPSVPVQVQSMVICGFSALVLTPVVLWEAPDFGALSAQGYGWMFLQGLISSFFAYLLYLTLIKRVGSVNTSQVAYLMPFAALLLGLFWIGEEVTPSALLALAMVVLGLGIKDYAQRNAPAKPLAHDA